MDYAHNPEYEKTNMAASLLCARPKMNGDLIIAYADCLVEGRVLTLILQNDAKVGVATDVAWKDYWQIRHGSIETDLKSLKFSPDAKKMLKSENQQ